jgi:uncharacterized phage protein gp47/JayE
VPAPSFDDAFNAARAELVLRRPDLFAEEGDVTDFLLAAVAAVGDYLGGRMSGLLAELFLDTAQGQALTTLADDRYAIQRTAATKAVGSVTLARPAAAAGAGSVPIGTIIATEFNSLGQTVEFVTTTLGSFGALALSVSVQVEAQLAGAAGNVAAGEVTRLVSTLFDSTITATNPSRLSGGAEEESDESLRERVRTFPSTIRRATLAALEYGAKTVAGVESAKASESDSGIVTVYVADGTGYSNAELNAAVQLELLNWRAAGVVVQVVSAEPLEQDLTFSVKAKSGFDVVASTTLIQDAIEARMAKLTMGEVLYLDELKAAVFALAPDLIQRVVFTLPALDVTPAGNQKVVPGTITVTAEP